MKKQNTAATATKLLKEDHKKVKDLFDQFEDTDDSAEKREIASTACSELTIHAQVEEEIFYPAVKAELDEDDLMAEAKEEHHVAKQLIAELEEGEGMDDIEFDAKFTVLAENVRHHIKEEEGEMFPKVEKSDLDLEELGAQMAERKQELQAEMGLKPASAAS